MRRNGSSVCWGFPGGNCRIHIHFFMRDIQAIRMEVQGGVYPRRIIYMKIRGQHNVLIIRIRVLMSFPIPTQHGYEPCKYQRGIAKSKYT